MRHQVVVVKMALDAVNLACNFSIQAVMLFLKKVFDARFIFSYFVNRLMSCFKARSDKPTTIFRRCLNWLPFAHTSSTFSARSALIKTFASSS